MATMSMASLGTLNRIFALRCCKQTLLDTTAIRQTHLRCFSRKLSSNHFLYTATRSTSTRSFLRTSALFRDVSLSTRLSCLHHQVVWSSSKTPSKSLLNTMYPAAMQFKVTKKGSLIMLAIVGVWATCCFLYLSYTLGAPLVDEEGNEIKDDYTWLSIFGWPLRAWKEGSFLVNKHIVEPSSEKLLPDPLKEPYFQPPYTLVLEHDGVLISSNHTLDKGWMHKKRPGLDAFLQSVGPPLFEVVIYTHKTGMTAFPITTSLDPNGFVSYRLFRDATLYDKTDGAHIKDLNCLNRDPKKVIVIETDHKRVKKHPHNALLLQEWRGEDGDYKLPVLATFLRAIAASGVDDVRPVLEYYSQFDDPLQVFLERQAKMREEQQAATQPQKQKKSLAGSWSLGLAGRKS